MRSDDIHHGAEIATWQSAADTGDERSPRLQKASNQTTILARAPVPAQSHEGPPPSIDEWQRDREHIASLETIIALLIEKNERMRQRLAQYTD